MMSFALGVEMIDLDVLGLVTKLIPDNFVLAGV